MTAEQQEVDMCESPSRVTPTSKEGLTRHNTSNSILSTSCTIEREHPAQSCDIRSVAKSSKFRPRFADEGLEDFESDTDSASEDQCSDTTTSRPSVELDECMKVGDEMMKDIERRNHVVASDLLRE